jgi:hypothetical protein
MLYSPGFNLMQFLSIRSHESTTMTDSGLSNRLRQHSRRSGIAVGITMAAAIALCVFTSAYIFGQVEPYVAEVIGYQDPTSIPEEVAVVEDGEQEQEQDSEEQQDQSEPTQAAADGQPTVAPSETTATTSAFQATHRSNPDFTINFRPGPSVSSGDPIDSLLPSTPLQYLDEDAIDEEGVIWLRVQTEAGQIGWIREVDTEVIIQ